MKPLITVVIPVFNGSRHIQETICSVLDQSYPHFELFIIDNQSTDSTCSVVRKWEALDKRIRLIQNRLNIGAIANWNKALSVGNGDYIKILPHDDLLIPGALGNQIATLDRHQECVLSAGRRLVINDSGRRLFAVGLRDDKIFHGQQLATLCARAGTNIIGEAGGVLFRRSASEKAGVFHEGNPWMLDLDYWLRLAQWGQVHHSRAVLSAFRVSASQWSASLSSTQADLAYRFFAELPNTHRYSITRRDLVHCKINALGKQTIRKIIYRILG